MACKLINLLISCTLACKLITCSLSITLNNLWYNLPQVTNVLLAFGYVNSFPKSSYPSNQFLLVVWFDFPADKLFQFMPQVFYGVGIRWLGWCCPPVYTIGSNKIAWQASIHVSDHYPAWSDVHQGRCHEWMVGMPDPRCRRRVPWPTFLRIYICQSVLACLFLPRHAPLQDALPCVCVWQVNALESNNAIESRQWSNAVQWSFQQLHLHAFLYTSWC